ncbi:Rha family transcriptional regulator [Methylobacterium sp. JK268]
MTLDPQGRPVTTSRNVAEVCEKRHDNVLRDIDALLAGPSDLRDLMFQEVTAHDPRANRETRYFNLTRDGVALLVMGFTGPKALAFKLAYIRRFNEMEETLRTKAPEPPHVPPQADAFHLASMTSIGCTVVAPERPWGRHASAPGLAAYTISAGVGRCCRGHAPVNQAHARCSREPSRKECRSWR